MSIQYRTTAADWPRCRPRWSLPPAAADRRPAAPLVGRRQPTAAEPEPNELLVLEWSGYEAPDFWTDFEAANPDTAVNFELGISDADVLSKMEAGSQADIFHFYTGWQQFYVDEGLVQEIDTSKLTNWDKVPDSFKELGQVDGKQYYLPWDWGFTSILYNTDQVPEVDSWDALFDETTPATSRCGMTGPRR